MVSKKIPLIIGPLPPPIGGVSVHVQRMIGEFKMLNYNFSFVNTKDFELTVFLKKLFKHKIIHLHSSNIYFQLIVSIFSFLFRKKLLVTFHRDIFRYRFLQRQIVWLIVLICDIPILLNEKSFAFSYKFNSNSKLISSFIPPDEDLEMSMGSIPDFSNCRFEKKFCTNAFNISYDKNGDEIYQISTLVKIFKDLPNYLLVVSDPSGAYSKFIFESVKELPDNIVFIPYPHSFFQVLKQTDCLIRFTTTDGDSLSVREALFLNKSVIASNIVDRPIGVTTINLNDVELSNLLKNIKLTKDSIRHEIKPNVIFQFINLYI